MKLSAIASLVALSASTAFAAVDKVILYADSYSDNGNDYKNSKFPPSPYWKGRFSDGPTWAEYFAKDISVPFSNNGYGGATTNNADAYSQFNGWTVPGIVQQVATLETHGTANSLYIIEIGYNDLNSIINPDQYHVVNKNYTYQKVAENVAEAVKNIQKKYHGKTFAFFNVAPFDRWPVVLDADKPKAKVLINNYNAYVEKLLKKSIKSANLTFYDSHSWFEEWLANPGALGLSIDNGPCNWGIGNTTDPCKDSSKHFFYDSYHPETKVHKAWAERALATLKPHYGL